MNIRKKLLRDGQIIPIIYDFSFTEIFNQKKCLPILERFISDNMMIPLDDIRGNLEILSRRLPSRNKKEVRKEVDLILNYKGEKIEIELNAYGPYKRVNDRNLVYIAKIFSENYMSGNKEIKKAYQINISNYPCNEKKLINEYYMREKDSKEIFSNLLQIDQIDVSKCIDPCYNFLNEREEKIAKWIKLFISKTIDELAIIGKDIMEKEELETLKDKVEELSSNEEMVEVLKTYEDNFNLYDDAKEYGYDTGYDTGKEDGIKEGIKQEKINLAKKMIDDNFPIDKIIEYTNLTKEEIINLKGE